jgi:hypothetical protein
MIVYFIFRKSILIISQLIIAKILSLSSLNKLT